MSGWLGFRIRVKVKARARVKYRVRARARVRVMARVRVKVKVRVRIQNKWLADALRACQPWSAYMRQLKREVLCRIS